jgi:hypothetical protein
MYLPFCRIFSLASGGYVVVAHLTKREFDTEFYSVSRILVRV